MRSALSQRSSLRPCTYAAATGCCRNASATQTHLVLIDTRAILIEQKLRRAAHDGARREPFLRHLSILGQQPLKTLPLLRRPFRLELVLGNLRQQARGMYWADPTPLLQAGTASAGRVLGPCARGESSRLAVGRAVARPPHRRSESIRRRRVQHQRALTKMVRAFSNTAC